MKQVIGLSVLVVFGAALWHATGRLNGEAVAMAIGVLFGVLAGVPMAIVVMSAAPRGYPRPSAPTRPQRSPRVVVLDGLTTPPSARAETVDARQWKVMGESEYWMEDEG